MKDRINKIVSLLLLVALYLNATGVVDNAISQSFLLSTTTEKSALFTQQSAILTTAANLPVASKVAKESSTSYFTFVFSGFSAVLKISQRLSTSEFCRYFSRLQNFPIQFQKYDIPFPFHVFW